MLNLWTYESSNRHDCGNLSVIAEQTQIGLLEESLVDLGIDESIAVAEIAPARYTVINPLQFFFLVNQYS